MESQLSVIVEAELADVEDWNQREAVSDATGNDRMRDRGGTKMAIEKFSKAAHRHNCSYLQFSQCYGETMKAN
ncbi:inorganic polyphosphate kinase [Sesbania bispinosa]|nr:inorganic polyphosphate kinase [Sesbania bispinosa]